MKTKILITFNLLLLFALENKAQSWSLTGNTAAATNFLGSTNNFPLNFRTNNTLRMFIKDGTNNFPSGNNGGYISIGNPPAAAVSC